MRRSNRRSSRHRHTVAAITRRLLSTWGTIHTAPKHPRLLQFRQKFNITICCMHVKYHCPSSSPSSMPHGTIVALQNVSKIATRSTAHSSNLWYGSTSPYLTNGHCLSETPSSVSAKQPLSPGKKKKSKKIKINGLQREFWVLLYLYNVVHPRQPA